MTSYLPGTIPNGLLPQLDLSTLIGSTPVPQGLTAGAQLAKWFPGSVPSLSPQPSTPDISAPSSAQDILAQINSATLGGGGNGGDIGNSGGQVGSGSGVGSLGSFGTLGSFDPDRAPSYSALGVPGFVGMGLNAAIPGLGFASTAMNSINTGLNYNDLSQMGYSMNPGQVLGGMLGMNSYAGMLDGAMNAAMANDAGRAALSGKGLSTADINAMNANFADSIMGDMAPADAPTNNFGASLGTSPNAPNPGGYESASLDGSDAGNMGGDMGGGFEGGFAGGSGDSPGDGGFQGQADGGRVGYASGGQIPQGSYILPADVMGAFGHGDNRVGASRLSHLGVDLVSGPGDGRSDSVAFSGPGGRQVRLSTGEGIMSPAGVRKMGGPDKMDKVVLGTRKKYRKNMGAFGAPE